MSQVYDVNSDAQQVVRLRAAGARSRGDIVWIAAPASAGDVLADVAVSSSATVRRAAVALHDIASGDIGLYCVRGPVQATVTSGNFTLGEGIETDAGNKEANGAADVSGAETSIHFAVALESGTTVTTLKIFMLGMPYTSNT
jgi:hypothetical protein